MPGHGPLVGTADGEHDAELRRPDGRASPRPPAAPRRCRGRGWPSPACRSATTASRSGSPRDSPRSWPTGCPRPRPRARTRPGAPGGPATPAPSPTRRAATARPPSSSAVEEATLVEEGRCGGRRSAPGPPTGRARAGSRTTGQGSDGRSTGRRWYGGGRRAASPGIGATVVGRAVPTATGAGRQEATTVAWDFETEPEFEAQAGLDARLRATRRSSRSRPSSSTTTTMRRGSSARSRRR